MVIAVNAFLKINIKNCARRPFCCAGGLVLVNVNLLVPSASCTEKYFKICLISILSV